MSNDFTLFLLRKWENGRYDTPIASFAPVSYIRRWWGLIPYRISSLSKPWFLGKNAIQADPGSLNDAINYMKSLPFHTGLFIINWTPSPFGYYSEIFFESPDYKKITIYWNTFPNNRRSDPYSIELNANEVNPFLNGLNYSLGAIPSDDYIVYAYSLEDYYTKIKENYAEA